MPKKLITTKYVPTGVNSPSGHMVKSVGYPSRRIAYDHGAQSPGQAAALAYVLEVMLPDMTKRYRAHVPKGTVLHFPDRIEAYTLPGVAGEAYVVEFMYVRHNVATDVHPTAAVDK